MCFSSLWRLLATLVRSLLVPHTYLIAQVIGNQGFLDCMDAPIHHVRGGHDVAA